MQIRWSIFPKFYQHLGLAELAALVREVGLDTTNLVIRDGYWVSRAGLARDLPLFMAAMRDAGLEVRFATAGFTPEELFADETPLALLAENGITEYRMSYFSEENNDPRASFAAARQKLERLAPLCEKHRIRCVYQIHHGTLIPSASAAYLLVQGLPAQWIGVELDPGNQSFEGYENWGRSARLLGEYLVAVGIKDSALVRDPAKANEPGKGWTRSWVPLDEGVTNWYDVARALKSINFSGTFVYMPFYDEKDPSQMTQKLKREVAYLRSIIKEVEAEE